MNRQNLSTRLERLERLRHPTGERFFMVWARNECELADAISEAKAKGHVDVGDKFFAKIWTQPTEPPPPRWTSLAEMKRDELVIIAGTENGITHKPAYNVLVHMTDADLSNEVAKSLPSLS